MQRFICAGVLCLVNVMAAAPAARAAFHLYDVKEVFSNADGTVQYVELFTSANGQQFLNGHTIVASQGASTNTFTFVGTGPSPTAGKHLLIATSAFEAACGVTPDFTLADNFLFDPNGSVNFGEAASIVTYTSLPLDGATSLNYPGEVSGTNTPTNFADATCTLEAPPEPPPEPPSVPSLAPSGLGALGAALAVAGLVLCKRAARPLPSPSRCPIRAEPGGRRD